MMQEKKEKKTTKKKDEKKKIFFQTRANQEEKNAIPRSASQTQLAIKNITIFFPIGKIYHD